MFSSLLRISSAGGAAHREIFLKSYQIKPKSECIYHFPIDLELNGRPFGSLDCIYQPEKDKYNLISV